MTRPAPASLTIGDAIRIKFGSKGSRVAVVAKIGERVRTIYAFKFDAANNRWKGPLPIYEWQIIERVDLLELAQLPALPWGN